MKFESQNRRSVLIIIPNARSVEFLRDTVDSIKVNTEGVNYNFLVISNNVYSENLKYLIDNNIFHINNEYNAGFPNAVNQGFRVAREIRFPYGFIMCDDVIINSNNKFWLRDMVDIIEEDSNVGIVSPREWNIGFPEFGNSYVEQVSLVATLCRVQFFHDVGGFDERFPLGYQDSDFCIMMNTYGRRVKVMDINVFEHSYRENKDILGSYVGDLSVETVLDKNNQADAINARMKYKQFLGRAPFDIGGSGDLERSKMWSDEDDS